MRLGRPDFNVCLVDDKEIERLNARFRGKPHPTDVLSFPWRDARNGSPRFSGQANLSRAAQGRPCRPKANHSASNSVARGEFKDFLGDVVISAETARRNARVEGHSTPTEIRWLVLHGLLHLLGYDHEKDGGEMTALELVLRAGLAIQGSRMSSAVKENQKAKSKE